MIGSGVGKKIILAHRLSWTLVHGAIPDGLCACHRCDVPACVNPSHLFLGTKRDNSRDMARKGRTGTRRKITRADLDTLRELVAAGLTQREIGERLGVHQSTVSGALAKTVRDASGRLVCWEPPLTRAI